MEQTFLIELDGSGYYPIALVNECKEEINDSSGERPREKITHSVIAANLTVEQVESSLPQSCAIAHIVGEYLGQCSPFDDYTRNYDGYIHGYGDEDAALLFYHYRRNPKYCSFASFGEKEFISSDVIDWIELNIHKATKENIETLINLCKTVQNVTGKKILVQNEGEWYDLDSVLGLLV